MDQKLLILSLHSKFEIQKFLIHLLLVTHQVYEADPFSALQAFQLGITDPVNFGIRNYRSFLCILSIHVLDSEAPFDIHQAYEPDPFSEYQTYIIGSSPCILNLRIRNSNPFKLQHFFVFTLGEVPLAAVSTVRNCIGLTADTDLYRLVKGS